MAKHLDAAGAKAGFARLFLKRQDLFLVPNQAEGHAEGGYIKAQNSGYQIDRLVADKQPAKKDVNNRPQKDKSKQNHQGFYKHLEREGRTAIVIQPDKQNKAVKKGQEHQNPLHFQGYKFFMVLSPYPARLISGTGIPVVA